MRERIRDFIRQCCAEMGVHIVKGVLARDHVHMCLSVPPRIALSKVMQQIKEGLHISSGQYARIVRDWVTSIGLEPSAYGTHSMRRTKVTLIFKKTGNMRAVQLLLGHTKMDSTVRYLGVELVDVREIAEAIEIKRIGPPSKRR